MAENGQLNIAPTVKSVLLQIFGSIAEINLKFTKSFLVK